MEKKTKGEKKMQVARLNVNFETEEEQQLLAEVKAAAALQRMKLREYVIKVFKEFTAVEREKAKKK